MSVSQAVSPRQRVLTAFAHQQPDRVPVDFLATTEIWDRLINHLAVDAAAVAPSEYYDPVREALLRRLEVDCRVLSYDMFCNPPDEALEPGARVEWWDVLSRSTPGRMWRQVLQDGTLKDIFGRHTRINPVETGAYEETASYPLAHIHSAAELDAYPWPQPEWWDFSALPDILRQLDAHEAYHIRFRIGSVFEVAWQLRGMEQFLMDLVMQPEIPQAIMTRLTDLYVENTRRALEIAGDRLDMVYFYDDVATQKSLLISSDMWAESIRPHHARLVAVAQESGTPVMYHSDGAMRALLPDLIALGVAVLNPIQADAAGMEPEALKQDFGSQLSFHGGIDIIKTLPRGTVEEVRQEVRDRIRVLGRDGGYVLASSHHIQSDTPLENVLAMYDLALR